MMYSESLLEVGFRAHDVVPPLPARAQLAARVRGEQLLDAPEHFAQRRRVRQIRDAEVIAVRDVETHARRDQDVLLLEEIERKLLIVEARQASLVDADEGVHCPMRWR